jgi:hypothetical protein
MEGWYINDKLESIWKEAVSPYSKYYYPDICVDGVRKVTEYLSEDSLCSGLDSNQVPPEYKSCDLSIQSNTMTEVYRRYMRNFMQQWMKWTENENNNGNED